MSEKEIKKTRKDWSQYIGQKFNRLTILSRIEGEQYFLCKCDCGVEKKIYSRHVITGRTTSCGCYWLEVKTTHGNARPTIGNSSTYISWSSAKSRCYQKKQPYYFNYGGRGIKMCDRWKDSFENFLADMGERPEGKTLDRIDEDKDYSPENCRWATRSEQSSNQRRYKRKYKEKLANMRMALLNLNN